MAVGGEMYYGTIGEWQALAMPLNFIYNQRFGKGKDAMGVRVSFFFKHQAAERESVHR